MPVAEPFLSRIEAFVSACAIHAAVHERVLTEIAKSFASKGGS